MNSPQKISTPIWGLTGGIGSGKSLAAKFFQDEGISVLNLDFLGSEVLDKDPKVHQELKNIFGESIILTSNLPDKKRIRQIIFQDKSKRLKLEALLHPLIWNEFENRAAKESKKGAKLILCEAALLIEHQHTSLFPRLIVVMACDQTRKHRVHVRDRMPFELIDEIMKTQVSDLERKKVATDILMNEGSPEELRRSVHQLVSDWKRKSIF